MGRRTQELLKACATDTVLLDALYQWASSPTGYTAVHRGFPPEHTLIRKNLSTRYGLTPERAEEVFKRLIELVEGADLSFAGGYLEAEPLIRRHIESSGVLRANTLKRLQESTDREKYVAWLFCRVKDDYSIWPHSRGYHAYRERMNRFLAILNATFDISAEEDEVLFTLIRLGFLNELQWVSPPSAQGGSRRENELVFPSYLEVDLRHIDDLVHLPPLPDASLTIDRLFSRSDLTSLTLLQEVLKRGWLSGEMAVQGMLKEPFVLGKKGGIVAVNYRLKERLRRELDMRLQESLGKAEAAFTPALEGAFGGVPLPEGAIGGGLMKVWRLHSGDRPLFVLLAPWFSKSQFEALFALPSPAYLILVTTRMSLSALENLYKGVFSLHPAMDRRKDWIFIELSVDGVSDRVYRDQPAGYEDLLTVLRMQEYARGHLDDDSTLSVFLGMSGSGEKIFWSPGRLQNGHFLIIGGTGAGKTETIRCIASELDRANYPVLMIDFHGDMDVAGQDVKTYPIREDTGYYFNPLELDPAFPEITPLRATSDFVDAISINFPTLGIQQREQLKRFIRQAYARAGVTSEPVTWNRELDFSLMEEELQRSDNRTAQTLSAYLTDAFQYRLFSGEEKISLHAILTGGITRINLRGLPESLRFLYADLFLRKLYYTLQVMGEIERNPLDDRGRFRLFVIVDEAKLLVAERQGIKAVLSKYASELRKFGVGLILASQLTAHFTEEVLANIEVKLCMKAQNRDQARKNARFFGVPEGDLLGLHQGEGILIMGRDRSRIKVVPSWERNDPIEDGNLLKE
ncbi:MAG TPA: ATP-binding protein [Methanomicrobiales archaeon]|nr:ATP-binding protein [Methanomicrobiales archaeon]